MAIEVLFRNINGVQEEVMRFVNERPKFANTQLEKQFRMFGINIPEGSRGDFRNLKNVSFPNDSSSPEQLNLFRQALRLEIAGRYSYRNYQWKIVPGASQRMGQ